MLKKLTLIATAIAMALPILSNASPTQASLNGSTGLIALPTAETLPGKSILVGSFFLVTEDPTGIMPRFLIAPIDKLELGVGVDIQDKHPEDKTALLNAKIRFYEGNEVNVAFGGNYQFNKDMDDSGQLFLAFTWKGWAKTTALIGKTIGEGAQDDNIDFGIGLEKALWNGSFGGLFLICDFSNFPYRVHYLRGIGSDQRAFFNAGLRINLFNNRFTVDAISADLLDEDREFVLSAAFNFTF